MIREAGKPRRTILVVRKEGRKINYFIFANDTTTILADITKELLKLLTSLEENGVQVVLNLKLRRPRP